MSDDEYEYDDVEEEEEEEEPEDGPALLRQASSGSDYAYEEGDDDDDGMYAMGGMDGGGGGGGQLSSSVVDDVAEVNEALQGARAGMAYVCGTVYVWLSVDTARLGLSAERASAWGLDATQAVAVRLDMHSAYTQASVAPRCTKAVQTRDSDLGVKELLDSSPCGLQWYLTNRVSDYLAAGRNWPPELEPRGAAQSGASQGGGADLKVLDVVDTCCCSEAVARLALERAGGDSSAAISMYFDDALRAELEAEAGAGGESKLPEDMPAPPPAQLRRQFSDSAAGQARRAAFEAELAQRNFLVRVIHVIEEKILNCTTRCLICDAPIEHAGVKPTVCAAQTCVFGYENLGLGVELPVELLNAPDLVDLLVSFLRAAATGGRVTLFFPAGVSATTDNGERVEFNDQDLPALVRVVDALPEVSALVEAARSGKQALKALLHATHPLAYPLLQWTVSSNRSHLRQLVGRERIPELPDSSVQYVLVTGPLERENRFQELKRQTRLARRILTARLFGAVPEEFCRLCSAGGGWQSEQVQGIFVDPNGTRLDNRIRLRVAIGALLEAERRNGEEGLGDAANDDATVRRAQQLLEHRPSKEAVFRAVYDEGVAEKAAGGGTASRRGNADTTEARGHESGSLFLWHGSGLGNWHVIARTSLKNMSNSKFMSAGAAYGAGIYFASQSSTSWSFSTRNSQPSWAKSQFGGNIVCLALCEVIARQEEFTHADGSIYVVPQEEFVTTRYFLICQPNSHRDLSSFSLTLPGGHTSS